MLTAVLIAFVLGVNNLAATALFGQPTIVTGGGPTGSPTPLTVTGGGPPEAPAPITVIGTSPTR
jgi:hypothetical protein